VKHSYDSHDAEIEESHASRRDAERAKGKYLMNNGRLILFVEYNAPNIGVERICDFYYVARNQRY